MDNSFINTPKQNLKLAVPFFMVMDMQKSIQFYCKGLGFELKMSWEPEGRIEWCWLEREGVALMLQEYREQFRPKDQPGIGVSTAIICEDALDLYREFLQNGLKPAEPFVGNGYWVVGLHDPDSYHLFFESLTDVQEGTNYLDWAKTR